MLRGSLSGSMTQSLSMTAVRPSIRASVTSGAGALHPQPLRASTISSTTANAPSQRRNAMQWITSRISQGLFWILTLGHCSVYMFGPGSFEEFSNFVLFVWATGAPLAAMTVLEVCIRVTVQAGPIWRWKSWRRMMIPLFHQLEALVLAVMAYRGGMSIYLLLVALQGANMPTSASDQDKATVLVLCAYRVLRTWGDCNNVSVQSTLRFRRKQQKRHKPWMDEYKSQLEQHRKLFFVRVQRAVDQRLAQLAFLSATLLYGFLEIQDAYPVTSEVVGYLLLLGFFCEFFCRAKAQGGESFFRPFYNKLELCVLAGGTWCLFYGTWYTEYLAEEKDQRAVVATATVCLLLLHRCIRLLAIRFQVSASDLHANTLMSAKALEVFIAKFGDLVEVPPTNIHVDVPGSRVHIEKATLKREVFEELHLPVTVQGGLIEDLFIDFFTPSAGARGAFARVRTHGRTKVRIKNLLLVTGAGRGLAEAGGSYGSYWTAEKIFEAKSRVVELIYKRLSAPFPDLRSLSQQSIDSRTKSTLAPSWTPPQAGPRQIAQKLRWKLGVALNSGMRRFRLLLQDSVFRHLELEIQNASLQFQDSTGALGHGCLSMGLKVDSLSLVRHARKRLTLDLARLAFYVEPHGPEASWQSKSLSRDRPQQVVQKMVRLNCAERLRSWAFSELRASMGPEQRLRHAERWPERHHVLTIPCVSLHAGPRQAEGEEEAPSPEDPAPRASDSAGSLGRALTRLTHVLPKRKVSDLEEQLFAPKEEEEGKTGWHWKLQVRPLSVTVDDVQLACVKHLHHCVRSWLAWDAAFRWRPVLTPLSPLVDASSRRAVIRFWWFYALHRVVAEKCGRRLRLVFLDLVLKAGYRFKYRSLLSDVLERSGPLVPGGRVHWKPTPQQQTQLQELQMHLPYPDIVSCGRAALAKAVKGEPALRAVEVAAEEELEAEEVEALEEEVEELEELEAASVSSGSSTEELEPSGSGTWELWWDGLEVCIPFWRRGRSYRPILLHVSFQQLRVEAEVLEKESIEGQQGRLAPFSLWCSLKSFSVASPEAGRHRPGAREILQVRRPVKMSSVLFDASYRVAPPEMLPGDVFAFVVQAKATGQAKEISAVLHAPELKLLLWEPLLLTLKAFTTRSGGRAGRGTLSLLERGRTTVGPMDGRVTAENGRVGPSKVKATFETVTSSIGTIRGEEEAHERTRFTKRLQAAQRFFERYAVIRDEVALDLVVHLGAIQVFQVGQFSKDQLGVEEARILPRRVWAKVAHDEIAKSCALGIEDVGRGPAAPWIAGVSHAEPGVRQEAPVEPPLGGLGASRRWNWCCVNKAASDPQASPAPQPTVQRSGGGEGLMQLAFWKVRESDFGAWIHEQEEEWRGKIFFGRQSF